MPARSPASPLSRRTPFKIILSVVAAIYLPYLLLFGAAEPTVRSGQALANLPRPRPRRTPHPIHKTTPQLRRRLLLHRSIRGRPDSSSFALPPRRSLSP